MTDAFARPTLRPSTNAELILGALDNIYYESERLRGLIGGLLAENERLRRDSDGTATAAINEDLSVPKDCQARAEGIAQSDMGKPITDAQTPGDTPHDHR